MDVQNGPWPRAMTPFVAHPTSPVLCTFRAPVVLTGHVRFRANPSARSATPVVSPPVVVSCQAATRYLVPVTGSHYFDRQGAAIDLTRWAELWEDDAYRFVERSWIVEGKREVVTVWNGFDPYRVRYDDGPPRIFVVAELFWANGKISRVEEHAMPVSEVEAGIVHEALVGALTPRSVHPTVSSE